MANKLLTCVRGQVPGFCRISRLPRQILGICPFEGDIRPSRVPLLRLGSGRPTSPFPHPWNYDRPIRILETYFWGADDEEGPGLHNRSLDVPGFAPVLVTRDPRIIRAITTETGDREGQFDRDTLPSVGIARATGKDTTERGRREVLLPSPGPAIGEEESRRRGSPIRKGCRSASPT